MQKEARGRQGCDVRGEGCGGVRACAKERRGKGARADARREPSPSQNQPTASHCLQENKQTPMSAGRSWSFHQGRPACPSRPLPLIRLAQMGEGMGKGQGARKSAVPGSVVFLESEPDGQLCSPSLQEGGEQAGRKKGRWWGKSSSRAAGRKAGERES